MDTKEKEVEVKVDVKVEVKLSEPSQKKFDIGPRPSWINKEGCTNEGYGAAD